MSTSNVTIKYTTRRERCVVSRFEYIGTCAVPAPGSQGEAWPAPGHDDPESCQYGAYMFQPDGDEHAYYVDPETDLRAALGEPL